MKTGKLNLITDVEGVLIGNAHDKSIKSGVTVFTSEKPFAASVSVLGGAPGTRETELLESDKLVKEVDALVLSGGSAYGLDAPSGVMDCLRKEGRGYQVQDVNVPIVPGAILFDLLNGGSKNWNENPYRGLAKEAYESKDRTFKIGTAGAGYGATTINLKGGLGSSSLLLENGITVGAIVAVNPGGSVVTNGSNSFWAKPFEIGNEFGNKKFILPDKINVNYLQGGAFQFKDNTIKNTTIAIVATDLELSKVDLKRISIAAHDGISRAIVPSHTPFDGDLVFAASTSAKKMETDSVTLSIIGYAAAICLSRAIARAVYEASPEKNDIYPTWKEVSSS